MPARVTSGEEARKIEVEYPATVIARMGQDGDLMVDATSSQAFQRILLDVTAEGRDLAGRVGKLVPTKSTRLAEMLNSGPPQSCRLLKVEQSNSSIIYDDKIYLKLFRKLEEGINPDLALTKQLSDKCGFEHVPAYLGDIQYVAPGQDPGSVVVIQACAPNEQDGWSHTQGPSVDTSIEFLSNQFIINPLGNEIIKLQAKRSGHSPAFGRARMGGSTRRYKGRCRALSQTYRALGNQTIASQT